MNSSGNQVKQQVFLGAPQPDTSEDNVTCLQLFITGKQFPVAVNNPDTHFRRSFLENASEIH
jgi:hypothetical protein